MDINKNISVWRGDTTPPTNYHLWCKSNSDIYAMRDGEWLLVASIDGMILFEQILEELQDLELKEIEPTSSEVYKSYALRCQGENVGDVINIPKDKSLKDVQLGYADATVDSTTGMINKGTGSSSDPQYLIYSMSLADGTYNMIKIDLSKFISEKEYSDGLELSENKLKVKKDATSEDYLSISSAGVKVSGINAKVSTLQSNIDANTKKISILNTDTKNLLSTPTSTSKAINLSTGAAVSTQNWGYYAIDVTNYRGMTLLVSVSTASKVYGVGLSKAAPATSGITFSRTIGGDGTSYSVILEPITIRDTDTTLYVNYLSSGDHKFTPQVLVQQQSLQSAIQENAQQIKDLHTFDTTVTAHITDKNNPHEVTKAQIGLDKVDNTADIDKAVKSASKLTTTTTLWGNSFDGTKNVNSNTLAYTLVDDVNLEDYVDLGLPSGTLWAKCNVGAEKETDYGLFFQWGDVIGYDKTNSVKYSTWATCPTNGGYSERNDTAISKWISKNTTNGVLNPDVDAAYVHTNGEQKMPTLLQIKELINETNHTWTTVNGVTGCKFINKKDHSKYIFFPSGGPVYDGQFYEGTNGSLWSSSIGTSNIYNASAADINSSYAEETELAQYWGNSTRGILNKITATLPSESGTLATTSELMSLENNLVDLGLPSGTLWAKCNVGAFTPADSGLFFQWGDIIGHTNDWNYVNQTCPFNNGSSGWDGTYWNKVKTVISVNNQIIERFDVATIKYGSGWRTPTNTQYLELLNTSNCTRSLGTQTDSTGNTVSGLVLTSVRNGNSIFFPYSGYYNGTTLNNKGTLSKFWTSTEDNKVHSFYIFYANNATIVNNDSHEGLTIRPVYNP